MSDDRVTVDPLSALVPGNEDEELLLEALRRVTARENRQRSEETTDEAGNPLPRLDLDDPRSSTDDPLLRVGYALLAHLRDHWLTAILAVTAAADEVRTWVMITKPDESPLTYDHLLYLPEVAAAAAALRRATYEPGGRGAWYNAQIRLNANGTIVASYDFDGPPFQAWGPGEVELLRRDQELYPRAPERLAVWHPAR